MQGRGFKKSSSVGWMKIIPFYLNLLSISRSFKSNAYFILLDHFWGPQTFKCHTIHNLPHLFIKSNGSRGGKSRQSSMSVLKQLSNLRHVPGIKAHRFPQRNTWKADFTCCPSTRRQWTHRRRAKLLFSSKLSLLSGVTCWTIVFLFVVFLLVPIKLWHWLMPCSLQQQAGLFAWWHSGS